MHTPRLTSRTLFNPPAGLRSPAALLAAALAVLTLAAPAMAQITVFEDNGFQGRNFTTQTAVRDLRQSGFNDRASSIIVGGSQQWEICDDSEYSGNCRVLRPGQYGSLAAMGMNDRVSSLRSLGRRGVADETRYAPPPVVAEDFRRRRGERLFEAPVISSRAVYGAPEQRCWTERQAVNEDRTQANVPGALVGAVIGGILGHQVGGGSGRDLATIGGVVAGGVVGSRAGGRRDGGTRDVQRCAEQPRSATPAYWDVAYEFRGITHRVQLTTAPGASITVNRRGEPRA